MNAARINMHNTSQPEKTKYKLNIIENDSSEISISFYSEN